MDIVSEIEAGRCEAAQRCRAWLVIVSNYMLYSFLKFFFTSCSGFDSHRTTIFFVSLLKIIEHGRNYYH